MNQDDTRQPQRYHQRHKASATAAPGAVTELEEEAHGPGAERAAPPASLPLTQLDAQTFSSTSDRQEDQEDTHHSPQEDSETACSGAPLPAQYLTHMLAAWSHQLQNKQHLSAELESSDLALQGMSRTVTRPHHLLVKPKFDKFINTAILQGKHLHQQEYQQRVTGRADTLGDAKVK